MTVAEDLGIHVGTRPGGSRSRGGALPATITVRTLRRRAGDPAPSRGPEAYERPKTRADCLPGGCNGARPCPWVSCPHHLYLSVNPTNGTIKLNFPDREVWELKETCALDVADRGGITLEETGVTMNLTRERIRQIENDGIEEVRAAAAHLEEYSR